MTATYAITRDEAIKAAGQLCLAYGQGEAPTSQDITDSLPFLQSLLKFWSDTEGYNAWLYKSFNFPSVAAKVSYTIGTGGDVTSVDRPVKIPQAWTQDAGGNKQPLIMVSRQDFEKLTPPNAPGPANTAHYSRELGLGVFYPWPVPSDTSLTFYCLAQRPIVDLAASGTATFDIEQSWYLPFIWGFAEQLMGLFGTEEQQCRRIEKNAAKYLERASSATEEDADIRFTPSMRGGGMRGRG